MYQNNTFFNTQFVGPQQCNGNLFTGTDTHCSPSNKSFNSPVTSKSEKPVAAPKHRGRGRRRRNVIYPIFEEAANCESDTFWNTKLLDAARGIFPSTKIKFEKGYLIYETKRKTEAIHIQGMAHEVAKDFCDFIRKYTDLSSDHDKRRMNMEMELAYIDRKEGTITNKELWFVLLIFIDEYSQYNKLDPQTRKSLYDTIYRGYRLDIIKVGTVNIVNGKIDNIYGLVFNYNTNKFALSKDALLEASQSMAKELVHDISIRKHEMYEPKGKPSKKKWEYMSKALKATGEIQEEL